MNKTTLKYIQSSSTAKHKPKKPQKNPQHQNTETTEHQEKNKCLSLSLNKAAGPRGRGYVVEAAGVVGQGN